MTPPAGRRDRREPAGASALLFAGCAALGAAIVLVPHGCSTEGCLSGSDDRCVVPAPCPELAFACEGGGLVEAKVLGPDDPLPRSIDALAAAGDVVLRNDRVVAVIDALDHPHYLAPTGGTILDLHTSGRDDDSINAIFTAVGLLPKDGARYESLEILEGEGFRAVQVRGTLDGHPDHRIATRYEIRPCEPGIRVRTEIVNREADAAIWALTDAFYWGGRSAVPFTPSPGGGFEHPDFTLTEAGDAIRTVPFMAASGHAPPSVAYATVACSAPSLDGFHTDVVSATGTRRRIVQPRDHLVYERFIAAVSGEAISPAVDVVADVRAKLFGEAFVALSGRVVIEGGEPLPGGENRAQVLISSEDASGASGARTPWTEAVPAPDGRFSAKVPANRRYVAEVLAFGRKVAEGSVDAGGESADLGDLVVPAGGRVRIAATVDGVPDHVLVLFHPADAATREATTGKLLGQFDACVPMLGPPFGDSPACNRVLVRDPVTIDAPVGRYEVYATSGPFATIDRRVIDVRTASTASVSLHLARLPVLPEGVLSADFHVHGGASFDSSIPDVARVKAFLAAGVDVIAATDHDVVSDYSAAIDAVGARSRLVLMTGVETTGHIPFRLRPDSHIPRVIGHWNFWPLPRVPSGWRRGAPADELLEPAELFVKAREAGLPESGVIQLNHPMSEAELGRDLGFARAIGMKLTEPLVRAYDGSAPSLFLRTPRGAPASNAAYDAQEVMNGTNNDHFLPFRSFWFYLLDQGVVRVGTANSDSHTLTDNVLGTPRSVVWTRATKAAFDEATFNADVKRGRVLGTNGPIIEISTTARDGSERRPSVEAFEPGDGARLRLRVSAAPWVPVPEVRIIVNGRVARTLTGLAESPDPFGREGLVRLDDAIDLAALLPEGTADAWLVVEAGWPLFPAADLDCDGVVDTGDNDGDGAIDWRDVDRNDDDVVDALDLDANEDGQVDGGDEPEACDEDQEVGPLAGPPRPDDERDPLHHFYAVTPGGYPLAFTNPLLFDRDGGGYSGPGFGVSSAP